MFDTDSPACGSGLSDAFAYKNPPDNRHSEKTTADYSARYFLKPPNEAGSKIARASTLEAEQILTGREVDINEIASDTGDSDARWLKPKQTTCAQKSKMTVITLSARTKLSRKAYFEHDRRIGRVSHDVFPVFWRPLYLRDCKCWSPVYAHNRLMSHKTLKQTACPMG